MARPHYIPVGLWETMSWKEQDFIILLREKRWTKKQIMRRLYITSEVGYWKLRKRVADKIATINSVTK